MRTLLYIMVIFLIGVLPLLAAPSETTKKNDAAEAGVNEREVTVELPRYYVVRKRALFLLDAPAYVIRGISTTFGVFGQYVEREKIVEKTIDLLSNDERTFFVYPTIEGTSGNGIGFGVALSHVDLFNKGYLLNAAAVVFSDLDQSARFRFGSPRISLQEGRRYEYDFTTTWLTNSDDDFYGIGNFTPESNQSEFEVFDLQIGAEVNYTPIKNIFLKPHVFFLNSKTESVSFDPDDDELPVQLRFQDNVLTGFEQRLTHFDLGLTLAHDSTDLSGAPEKGGRQSFTFRRLQGVEQEGFNYFQYDVDVTHYFRLWKPRRVLVLRNAWTFQQTTGSNEIPFHRLARLDLDSPLRGYERGRFRQDNSILFNFEYRYLAWDMIDVTLFYDTGRVFDEISDIEFTDFQYSYGGGLRFRTPKNDFLFRAQVGYGGENLVVSFNATKAL